MIARLQKLGVSVVIAFTIKGLATTGLMAFAAAKSFGWL